MHRDRSRARPMRMLTLGAAACLALLVGQLWEVAFPVSFVGSEPGRPKASRVSRSAVAEDVDAKIAGAKVLVVSKEWCPFCMRAKNTLKKLNIEFETLELEDAGRAPLVDDPGAIQDYMMEKTGGRSVPRVFIGGEFIGGCDDTVKLANSGELEDLAKKAGAL
eukprot:CAMPEP_0197663534 /NCGR_PEP_ID=MMETSP1338-20131121/57774_1 /TAXON_ID=43686 ORGANISM="Pelagodinium beii, Strain RCC1491" /NCGR_SAMPLE_ID=MMETSP1338 /ASSEMBLY_ACC=CAM_ASM_000754 /LENGTH=162 /DNA_ID=CAMNT_0043241957 /DNA_START=41 /DNA_END=529 /DNA_ORIENTATION=+